MTARIFYLTGEWPSSVLRGQHFPRNSIERYESCYYHYFKCLFAHRCRIEAENHCVGDVWWGDKVARMCDQNGSMMVQLETLRVRSNVAKGCRRRNADERDASLALTAARREARVDLENSDIVLDWLHHL